MKVEDKLLIISTPRPYFAEVPYYLWSDVNYDSDGDCRRPTDREWTWLRIENRVSGDEVEIWRDGNSWRISGDDPYVGRTLLLLRDRCKATFPNRLLSLNDDWDHSMGMHRADKVRALFQDKRLSPFDDNVFFGSWTGRSARKSPQNDYLMGKSSKKRADCSKRTAANPYTMSTRLIFGEGYFLTQENCFSILGAVKSKFLSIQ